MTTPRFFNYSATATDDYKTKLAATLTTLDRSNAAVSYTPSVAAFALGVVNALQVGLNTGTPVYGIVSLCVTAASALVTGISKSIASTASESASEIIQEGVTCGFFASPPIDVPSNVELGSMPAAQAQANLDQHVAATRMRLIHP